MPKERITEVHFRDIQTQLFNKLTYPFEPSSEADQIADQSRSASFFIAAVLDSRADFLKNIIMYVPCSLVLL